MDAPPPKVTEETEPFIPYVDEEGYPENLRPQLKAYQQRMGFLPNALKLYMHRPELAETVWQLNNKVMRDPSSTLDLLLKRKLAVVCCSINGCAYCTAHSCYVLKKPAGMDGEGWGLTDKDLSNLITGEAHPADEMEKACFDYARAASTDPSNVPDEILDNLKKHLDSPQIMELACLVGFWKFYNTVHDSLHIPVETDLLGDTGFVDLA